jgi:hypothetical protein
LLDRRESEEAGAAGVLGFRGRGSQAGGDVWSGFTARTKKVR